MIETIYTRLRRDYASGRTEAELSKEYDLALVDVRNCIRGSLRYEELKRKHERKYSVYEFEFISDGMKYVGITINTLEQREYEHRTRETNPSLYQRLNRGKPYTLKVISRHKTEEKACLLYTSPSPRDS